MGGDEREERGGEEDNCGELGYPGPLVYELPLELGTHEQGGRRSESNLYRRSEHGHDDRRPCSSDKELTLLDVEGPKPREKGEHREMGKWILMYHHCSISQQ